MPYIYRHTETDPDLWTVGTYDSGKWEPASDHDDEREASDRVIVLNGGTPPGRIPPESRDRMHPGSRACDDCYAALPAQFDAFPTICTHRHAVDA